MNQPLSQRPYPTLADAFDESYDRNGVPRAHWRDFFSAFDRIGEKAQRKRWDGARRMIHEHGITYDLFGDPDGMERPFELDPVPYVMAPDEWPVLEAAVAQRARLLNQVLKDIFGPRRLLKASIIPPAVLLGHPGFDRACIGVLPDGVPYLQLYAADLCRGADGAWRFLTDRTEAPSGLGYLLENRVIVSHALEEMFRGGHVRRLAPFYATLIAGLTEAARRHLENPRIVLLCPGPKAHNYFEHAYLSRYLGFTLAEPADLTVRDSVVYLKTLGGLRPVDVVFRRISSDGLDPLMQRREDGVGVPGLLESVRAGNVVVSNAVGCGVVEAPVFMPFIAGMCRELLAEEPCLPSVPLRWCGDGASLDEITEHLDEWWIQPAFEVGAHNMVAARELSRADKAALIDRLRAQPRRFVAMRRLSLSTVPVFEAGRYVQKRMILRLYAQATPTGYEVLPGGLTRVADRGPYLVSSKGHQGGSKDTWLQAPGPVAPISIMKKRQAEVAINRSIDLPSRVADDLFWLGRYVERTEFRLRLLRSAAARISGETAFEAYPELPVLLEALAEHRLIDPALSDEAEAGDTARVAAAIGRAVLDPKGADTLGSVMIGAFNTASRVRDRLSLDAWRVVSRFERSPVMGGDGDRRSPSAVLDYLNELNVTLSAFSGIAMETMTRGLGWRFLDIGRRLERAHHTALLLKGLVPVRGEIQQRAVLEAVLEVAASAMTFRARYRSTMQIGPVLDLLVSDESNPRSIAFQVAAIAEHLSALPREESVRPFSTPEERVVIALLTAIRLADPVELTAADGTLERSRLQRFLFDVEKQIPALSDHLTLRYMAHVETPRQLASRIPKGVRPR